MTSRKRMRTLVHYVCDRCGDPTKLGATKLSKVLWYVDTFAYRLWGRTVSGETEYVKRQFGPVPKNILKVLRELEARGDIFIRETTYFGRPKREYQVKTDVDHSAFTDEERQIIDQVVAVVCDHHTATSISDLSHDLIWEAAELGEEIPVFAVLASQASPVTAADVRWAKSQIKESSALAA